MPRTSRHFSTLRCPFYGLLFVFWFLPAAPAQGPTLTGEVTVRLNAGIDSASGRPFQNVVGRVVSATDPTIPRDAMASVQLLRSRDGFSFRLIRIVLRGQAVSVASVSAEVVSGGSANVISSARVVLAPGTDVRFTLPGGTDSDRPRTAPTQTVSRRAGTTAPSANSFSETQWTPFKSTSGIVPDAVLMGKGSLVDMTPLDQPAMLQVGCDKRGDQTVPVLRIDITPGVDVKDVPTTPSKDRSKTMDFNVTSGDARAGDQLFIGFRPFYVTGRRPDSVQIQYDADLREIGAFGAPSVAGKYSYIRLLNVNTAFKLPAPNDAMLAVLTACKAQPYDSLTTLSPAFIEQELAAIDAIRVSRATSDKRMFDQDKIDVTFIGIADKNASDEIGQLESMSRTENVKSKSGPPPPRRKRCADALAANLKAGSYATRPAACAYLDQLGP